MTNFERITKNEESLADFILRTSQFCEIHRCKKYDDNCGKCLIDWLKQETEKQK